MLDVKALIGKILNTDLVIESGTDSNGWVYKKYSSGLFEAEKFWAIGQYTIGSTEVSPFRVGNELNIVAPVDMISGSIMSSLLGSTSNSPVFLEHFSDIKVRIAKAATSNVTLQNVTLGLKTVNGRWK